MVIENVKQVPYNVSLLGVVHGIANSYGMELSAARTARGGTRWCGEIAGVKRRTT